jgi:hypothetical protein
MFFFLDEKEPKNQERTPTPIFFGAHSARIPEKIVVRTVRSRPRTMLSEVYSSIGRLIKK